MLKLTLNVKNFKLLTNISEEFLSGNLYLVKGKNSVGKTSFWQSLRMIFKADNPNPNILSFGTKEGFVEGDIEKESEIIGADGEKYIAKCEFKEGKEDKFSLIMPDATVRKSKKDIRDIFKYNDFTVEEFLGWGLTEAGRRKQAEMILEFLPATTQTRIAEIDKQINNKSGILYVTRSGKNETLQGYKKVVENTIPLTAEEESILSKETAALESFNAIKKDLDALDLTRSGEVGTIHRKAMLETNITNCKKEKEELEERLKVLDKTINEYETLLKDIPESTFNQEEYDALMARKDKGQEFINKVSAVKTKKENIILNEERLEKAQKEWKDIDDKIEAMRLEKKSLFEQAKLPMDNIIINDGELFFVDDKGNQLNFTEEQISYSIAGKRIAKLLLERNKNLPIIAIGKAAEYDQESLKELADLAKEYDAIIFCDKVVPEKEELSIEVYES